MSPHAPKIHTARITVKCPPELLERVQAMAALRALTVGAYVRGIVEAHVPPDWSTPLAKRSKRSKKK